MEKTEQTTKKTKTKKKFLSEFFKILAGTTLEIGEAFTLDFYLHRGRRYNLYYPDDHERFNKGFSNLKQRGYITPAGNKFKFTKKGKKWYQENVYKYTPFKDPVWDKKWRVVFFDIPEKLHTKRDIFRSRLRNLGFYPLQKSMLALPFKCGSDIAELCRQLKISQYVDILTAESIGAKEEELKKIFNL